MLHPREFQLQVVKRVPSAFDNADWLFEIKHDGFRVLAFRASVEFLDFTDEGYLRSPAFRRFADEVVSRI